MLLSYARTSEKYLLGIDNAHEQMALKLRCCEKIDQLFQHAQMWKDA